MSLVMLQPPGESQWPRDKVGWMVPAQAALGAQLAPFGDSSWWPVTGTRDTLRRLLGRSVAAASQLVSPLLAGVEVQTRGFFGDKQQRDTSCCPQDICVHPKGSVSQTTPGFGCEDGDACAGTAEGLALGDER